MNKQQKSGIDRENPSADRVLALFLNHLKKEHRWTEKQLRALFKEEGTGPQENPIPVSLFSDRTLSAFELIVRYMRDTLGMGLSEIARSTNRDPRTVWSVYHAAKQKHPSQLKPVPSDYTLTPDVVADRTLSVLESIVHYLHEHYGIPHNMIAQLLRRDPRTIHTVKKRIQIKLNNG
jgi:hypothetical protein